MRFFASFLLTGVLIAAPPADLDSKALLETVRSKVLRNAKAVPRYVCRQEIERRDFELAHDKKTPLPYDHPARICEILGAEEPGKSSRLKLMDSDRAKLDVMLATGTELFAWPGERRFDVKTPGDLIGGGFSGNGDFAGFLIDVFAPNQARFHYQGSCGAACAHFAYEVPPEVSRYTVKAATERATVGFHGTFDVDPRSADLLQLTVIADDLQKWLGAVCETRTRMTYRVNSDVGAFLVPQSSESEFLATDGSYSVNRVSYIGCRRYSAESVVSFAGDGAGTKVNAPAKAPALPVPGSTLRLRFLSEIDSEISFAGDSVSAALDRPVLDTDGGEIPAGTSLHGHVAQLKKLYGARPQVEIALRFDTIVLHDLPVPIRLEARGKMDDHGRAVFRFSSEKTVLGKEFVSQWRVR